MRHILKAAGLGLALALTLTACGGSDNATISSADRTKASAATLENGTDINVELDDSFAVTNNPPRASDFVAAAPATPTTTPSDAVPTTPTTDLDDRPLTGDTLAKASAAHVYEVEVQFSNGQDVTVELDKNFKVTRVDK